MSTLLQAEMVKEFPLLLHAALSCLKFYSIILHTAVIIKSLEDILIVKKMYDRSLDLFKTGAIGRGSEGLCRLFFEQICGLVPAMPLSGLYVLILKFFWWGGSHTHYHGSPVNFLTMNRGLNPPVRHREANRCRNCALS